MTYEVKVGLGAKQRIREQAEHIAVEQGAPGLALEWLNRVSRVADGLAEMPRRYPRPAEDAWCDYEVRHVPIGEFMLFFTIIDEAKTVWVIHARHGKQLSKPSDFPTAPDTLDDGS